MKRIAMMILLLGSSLLAMSGAEVFQKKCASCHDYYIPQSMLNRNYQADNQELNLTAPTLTELSFRLKDQVGDRKADAQGQKFEIEAFLETFLKNPAARQKSILPRHVRKQFGTMPPVDVSEDEIELLADFIYEYAEQMMRQHGVKRYSYKEALQKAKAERKIILIEGFIPYCRGCIWMDRNVMVEPEVKEALNKDFLLVKMNLLTEKLPLGIKRLGTPSFYFIDSDGTKVIDMLEGRGTVEEFLELLRTIRQKARQ